MTKEQWGQLKERLLGTVGQNNFTQWIEPLRFEELIDGIATFAVSSSFMGNYVSQNFSDVILSELQSEDSTVRRLNFKVLANAPERPRTVHAPAVQAGAAAPLDSRFTFDSFVVGKPNELAHAAARRVAEGGPVTFNPLFLYGGVGLGKTHLMHAISWELQLKKPELNVLYLSAEQFMYRVCTGAARPQDDGFQIDLSICGRADGRRRSVHCR